MTHSHLSVISICLSTVYCLTLFVFSFFFIGFTITFQFWYTYYDGTLKHIIFVTKIFSVLRYNVGLVTHIYKPKDNILNTWIDSQKKKTKDKKSFFMPFENITKKKKNFLIYHSTYFRGIFSRYTISTCEYLI